MSIITKRTEELNMEGFICRSVWLPDVAGEVELEDIDLQITDARIGIKNDDDDIIFIETPSGRLSFNRPQLQAFIGALQIIRDRYE